MLKSQNDSRVSELDCLIAHLCVIANDIEVDQKFYLSVKNGSDLHSRLMEALAEKQRLENVVAVVEKEYLIKTDKLNVAMNVVQHEKKQKEKALSQRNSLKLVFEQLLTALPERRAKEFRGKIARLTEVTSATNTDIDITTDSTFFSSAMPSSGVESDVSPPTNRKHRKIDAFTPILVSSLREYSVDRGNETMATECSLASSIPSTFLSEDSRKSVIFYSTILENLKNRAHAFARKTLVLGEQCSACETKVACGRRALQCEDCRCISHENCSEKVPKPCISVSSAAFHHSKSKKSIIDHSPRFAPFVPAIIVHCVIQIENRGLNVAGLYKVSTFDRTVEDLKHQMCKNRGVPNLCHIDVLAICQFLKDFFASLKPALITAKIFENLLEQFERIPIEKIPFEMVFNAMDKFEPTNRDTLAFLVLHLQNVVNSKAADMTAQGLSKIFTSVLVDGYQKGLYKEEKRKWKLLKKFIELPSDYWKIIFTKDV